MFTLALSHPKKSKFQVHPRKKFALPKSCIFAFKPGAQPSELPKIAQKIILGGVKAQKPIFLAFLPIHLPLLYCPMTELKVRSASRRSLKKSNSGRW